MEVMNGNLYNNLKTISYKLLYENRKRSKTNI